MTGVFARLGKLPENTTKAVRHIRLNGKVLADDTRTKTVGNGHYVNGFTVTRLTPQIVHVESWTVENAVHVWHFECDLEVATGKLKRGSVNLFAMGVQAMDDGYLEEFYRDCKDIKWDQIITRPPSTTLSTVTVGSSRAKAAAPASSLKPPPVAKRVKQQ